MIEKTWNVLGLMSGTSLDGLDIAHCRFITVNNEVKSFELLKGETFNYSVLNREDLNVMKVSAVEFAAADFAFGRYCGERVVDFMNQNHIKPDFIASHGHTIFHQPEKGFTTQIGNGAAISAICGLPVISDFRSMDVALGGQGAPLVPVGDLLLFKKYHYCLNLGGIANISIKKEDSIIAFDTCPANMALNLIAGELGVAFDDNGSFARSGKINDRLLFELNELQFYKLPPPKSLGKEWFENVFFPVIQKCNDSPENKLHTVCEHIGIQISRYIDAEGEMLITGGGAFNSFLVKKIQEKSGSKCRIVVPDKELAGFKEALIFAFLGLLRVLNKPNALTTVTGASVNSIGGALYGDFSNIKA